MTTPERKALLDGITAGLALGHIVGGTAGTLLGAYWASPLICFAGLACAATGAYVAGRLYANRRYPFNRRPS